MGEITRLYPMTMIHEVFHPSNAVVNAVEDLTGSPPGSMKDLKVFSSASRLIHTSDYNTNKHALEIKRAGKILEPLAKRALYLSGHAAIQERGNGSTRLLLQARHQDQLNEMAAALDAIDSVDVKRSLFNLVYVDLAIDSLTENIITREKVLSKMHHPSVSRGMYLTKADIACKDIPRFPLPYSWAADEYV